MDRARKAEDRGELREAHQKRRVSQRKAMRVLEIRARDKAARNIQVELRMYSSYEWISGLLFLDIPCPLRGSCTRRAAFFGAKRVLRHKDPAHTCRKASPETCTD